MLKEVWITIAGDFHRRSAHHDRRYRPCRLYFLGLPLITALLLGSTIASTDPATLVPVFKQVRIKDRVAQTVMSESAFNDAMGAIVTFTIMGIALGTGGEVFRSARQHSDLAQQRVDRGADRGRSRISGGAPDRP